MEIKEYAKEVAYMLNVQQEYFRTRSKDVLVASKQQERKVAQMTKEILEGPAPFQPSLFDNVDNDK